jgi:hypothetical protein
METLELMMRFSMFLLISTSHTAFRSEMAGRERVAHRRQPLQRRPKNPIDLRWPSPVPMPILPTNDVGKLLERILERLDAIEKRLDRIEKMLMQRQSSA